MGKETFTHPTLLANPKYDPQAYAVLARLNQAGYTPTLMHTEPNVADTTEAVAARYASLPVDPSDSPLLVIGGDGTVDFARRALVAPAVRNLTGGVVPLSSIGGGFARDHRRDSHGEFPKDPARILKHSTVVPAGWVVLDIENGDTTRQLEATLYAGIGKTAYGAALANSRNPSEPKPVRALRIGLGTIFDDTRLRASVDGGVPRALAEITVATSGRMSMIGRFPTVLWKDEMHLLTVRPGRFWAAMALARLATGISDGHNMTRPVAIEILTDTRIHHDGEPPEELPANSRVTARLSDETYPLLTSRRSARMLHAVQSLQRGDAMEAA